MGHQVSLKCYVSLQAKVGMSHGTGRPLAFVNTVTSLFLKKSRKFLDQLTYDHLPERHSDPCASVINTFCVLVADGPMGKGQTSEHLLGVSLQNGFLLF